MHTVLHFVRHGRTIWNETGRYQGQSDLPLSETGRRDAHRVASSLARVPLDVIYSSDLRRAAETAQIIAKTLSSLGKDIDIKYEPALREINFGLWEGLTIQEIKRRWGTRVERWYKDPYMLPPPGGEPFGQFQQRVVRVLEQLVAQFAGRQVAIVTHGGVITVALAWVQGHSMKNVQKLPVAPGQLLTVKINLNNLTSTPGA